MTARFPAAQREALTRLRTMHPGARVTVPARQPRRPALRVLLKWAERSRQAYVLPNGRVILVKRSMREDRQGRGNKVLA